MARAVLERVRRLTPTTSAFTLRLAEPFAFEPGQWVDLQAPGVEQLGGYTPTSDPALLPLLELAVKASDYPPAAWLRESAAVGDEVRLSAGGSYTLAGVPPDAPLLFVAGGVGVNPFVSMLRAGCARGGERPVALLYSARGAEELAFRDELAAVPGLAARFVDTAEQPRIAPEALAEAAGERLAATVVFICGPPAMIDELEPAAEAAGFAEVRVERWW